MASLTPSGIEYRERALRSLGQLPPFSLVLNRLVATLADEDVSYAELATLIEKDTVVAGHVLRVVNSALYGCRGTVSSVRHAVSLMGLIKVRNIALSLSVSRLWTRVRTPPSWDMSRFNLHSVGVGILADLLAQRLPVDYAEGAFAAGLLHDIGKLLIALALPDEFEEIARRGDDPEAERDVVGFGHAELSGLILSRWNLPEPIQKAVWNHHAPLAPPVALRPLWEVVAVADRTAIECGFRAATVTAAPDRNPASALASLGLAGNAAGLLGEFVAEFDAVRQFF